MILYYVAFMMDGVVFLLVLILEAAPVLPKSRRIAEV